MLTIYYGMGRYHFGQLVGNYNWYGVSRSNMHMGMQWIGSTLV